VIKGKLMKSYVRATDILLEQGQYESALKEYQEMLEKGEWDSDIIDRIYKDFILPEREMQRKIYDENCKEIPLLDYENCLIEIIPLSDDKYILFDAQKRRFIGNFCFADFHTEKKKQKSFSSLLITDMWDIRNILALLQEKEYANVYIVLNDAVQKFMSFFKLPDIQDILPSNLRIFASTEDMLDYFTEFSDVYLPRKIISADPKMYQESLNRIHKMRIQSRNTSNNVFLSICIPSYNRGPLALHAVKCALQMDYDSEVEIVISNNGSSIGCDEYQIIKGMQDSRVHYYEFEENIGMASNVYSCLRKATGHYAVLFSDEDSLIVEQLEQFLDYLNQSCNLGCCIANGDDVVRKRYAGRFPKGAKAFLWAIRDTTYITGCCFNMDYFRSHNLFDQINYWRGNRFETAFPNSVCAVLLAKELDTANTGMVLWHYEGSDMIGGNERIKNGKALEFLTFDTIMGQEYDLIKFMEKEMPSDFKELFLAEVERTFSYFLADGELYDEKIEYFKEKHGYDNASWLDICILHYKNCLNALQESELDQESKDSVLSAMDKIFLDWLECRRIRKFCDEKENLKTTLRAHLVRYYWEKGIPFLEINFEEIDKKLDVMIGALS